MTLENLKTKQKNERYAIPCFVYCAPFLFHLVISCGRRAFLLLLVQHQKLESMYKLTCCFNNAAARYIQGTSNRNKYEAIHDELKKKKLKKHKG